LPPFYILVFFFFKVLPGHTSDQNQRSFFKKCQVLKIYLEWGLCGASVIFFFQSPEIRPSPWYCATVTVRLIETDGDATMRGLNRVVRTVFGGTRLRRALESLRRLTCSEIRGHLISGNAHQAAKECRLSVEEAYHTRF
jgi:hypothetical protein